MPLVAGDPYAGRENWALFFVFVGFVGFGWLFVIANVWLSFLLVALAWCSLLLLLSVVSCATFVASCLFFVICLFDCLFVCLFVCVLVCFDWLVGWLVGW